MTWYTLWYNIPAILTVLFSMAVAWSAWQRRPAPGTRATLHLMGAIVLWSLAAILESTCSTLEAKLFWTGVEYLGFSFESSFWLLMVLDHCGERAWFTLRRLLLLFAIPVLTILLNWTNAFHHLMYTRTWVEPMNGVSTLFVEYGPWYVVLQAFNLLLILSGLLIARRSLASAPPLFKKQLRVFLFSALLPIGFLALFLPYHLILRRLGWVSGIDLHHLRPLIMVLTPLVYLSTAGTLIWGIRRVKLMDVTPIAHRLLLERLPEGVLVLDEQRRIVKLNAAASRFLEIGNEHLGDLLEDSVPAWFHLPDPGKTGEAGEHRVTLPSEDGESLYEVHLIRLELPSRRFAGQMLVIRDLTESLKIIEERERYRFAQYLHDDVGQTLAGAMMQLAKARQLDGEKATERLQIVENLLETALIRARSLAYDHAPAEVKPSLAKLMEEFSSRYGLRVDIEGMEGLASLAKMQSALLFRILRELLFNIVKHAQTKKARVRFARKESSLEVRVEDEGVGFPQPFLGEGFGLPSIREQLSLVGGAMEIRSEKGKGTCVDLKLPL